MTNLYLDKQELEMVNRKKGKYLEKRKRKFAKKKMNHLNNERLEKFYNQFLRDVKYSEKLFLIKFKSCFSFYLYLYLKSQAKGFNTEEGGAGSCLSEPIEFSICGTQRLTGLVRNTVRKAFRDLIAIGLVFYKNDLLQKRHNLTRAVILLNDDCLLDWDDKNRKVIYSINNKT
ncbi:hypothetical protein ACFLSV_07710 [Bacteroidota bacterium]